MPHSQDTRHMRYETLYIMLLIFASGLFLAGALLDTPDNIARGLIRIVMTEDPLITDYVRLAGVGAALINSSVVTALSVLILRSSGERLHAGGGRIDGGVFPVWEEPGQHLAHRPGDLAVR
mgnify:CR=1 FL=1